MGRSDPAAMRDHDGGQGNGVGVMDSVFVLYMGRSGPTLLRLILDTRPDLARPPETSIPAPCSQLAVVWSLIEGAPLPLHCGDTPPEIPDAAIAGIRHTTDRMTALYLRRRGKKLYCDKSLGTTRYAQLLTRICPGTRFMIVHRRADAVVRAIIDASRGGPSGPEFAPFVAAHPGKLGSRADQLLGRAHHPAAGIRTGTPRIVPARPHRGSERERGAGQVGHRRAPLSGPQLNELHRKLDYPPVVGAGTQGEG